MNRIKIIKRANRQVPLKRDEREAKKVETAAVKRQSVKVIGNWVDEWRASKSKDARRTLADLFNAHPSAIG